MRAAIANVFEKFKLISERHYRQQQQIPESRKKIENSLKW
jgi:hypothetical protein